MAADPIPSSPGVLAILFLCLCVCFSNLGFQYSKVVLIKKKKADHPCSVMMLYSLLEIEHILHQPESEIPV